MSYNETPQENFETVEASSPAYFTFLQEDPELDFHNIFGAAACQGNPMNEHSPHHKDGIEEEEINNEKATVPMTEVTVTGTENPGPAKPEESNLALEVATKKDEPSPDSLEEEASGSTEPSSVGTQQPNRQFFAAVAGQPGSFEDEHISDNSPITQVGSYTQGENSDQAPVKALSSPVDSDSLVQHDTSVEDGSTRESSPREEEAKSGEISSKSKNIQKKGGRKPKELKNKEDHKENKKQSKAKKQEGPQRSAVYRFRPQYISKEVLDLVQTNSEFQNWWKENCKLYEIDRKEVERYLLYQIKGSKVGGKTKTGKAQEQAKVANFDDVKDLLDRNPNVLYDPEFKKLEKLKRLQRGARLAFEIFFVYGFYEKWAEMKCEKLAKEVLVYLLNQKDEVHKSFLPQSNEWVVMNDTQEVTVACSHSLFGSSEGTGFNDPEENAMNQEFDFNFMSFEDC